MIDTKGEFYLGRIVDTTSGKATDKPLLYDPADLTTHAFVVGMTGSGKTGLCVGILEEAALNGLPALMIDPKGDITNLLLHFPDLLPQDFQPWVNADEARRAGQTIEQAAAAAAASWKKGLSDWDIDSQRIQALKDSAKFTVFTPGSDSGVPVSILASLEAPDIPWETNREILRERISSTVTALLGLVGVTNIDPVRSREHILLANIFEHAWSQGKDLSLTELILQTQNPPFEKLGVFDVNTFFPEKDRFGLAMMLNNILAAPAFQTWIEGQPLDIPSLLYTADGKPRHSIFYIAHLSDAERMFFVTLLFSAVETWMRTQSGTTTLRALIYFDEIFGYMPPVANPASKEPMLRMLKQARAFGVGLILVTQNPVDVDYKGLSNTGSWFIGKLQTDQDKQRLLDGLEGAVSGGLNRAAYDRMISGLGKRVFLLHNVHNKEPVLMQTRWVMNYLAGPLTRAQIPPLNALAGALVEQAAAPSTTPAASRPAAQKAATTDNGQAPEGLSITKPPIPIGIDEFFLPNNLTFSEALKHADPGVRPSADQELVYYPVLLGQTRVYFLNRKYNLEHELTKTVIVPSPSRRSTIHWEDYPAGWVDPRRLDDRPISQARFAALNAPLSDAKTLAALQKDLAEWTFRSAKVVVRANAALNIFAGPEVSEAEFQQMCSEAARKQHTEELKKAADAVERKLTTQREKLKRVSRELEKEETKLSQRKIEELGKHAETVLGLFSKRKKSISGSLTKRRMTAETKAKVEELKEVIADLEKQIARLEDEKTEAIAEVEKNWGDIASQSEQITVTPLKKDISVELFGVAWFPYYQARSGDQVIMLPAYGDE